MSAIASFVSTSKRCSPWLLCGLDNFGYEFTMVSKSHLRNFLHQVLSDSGDKSDNLNSRLVGYFDCSLLFAITDWTLLVRLKWFCPVLIMILRN